MISPTRRSPRRVRTASHADEQLQSASGEALFAADAAALFTGFSARPYGEPKRISLGTALQTMHFRLSIFRNSLILCASCLVPHLHIKSVTNTFDPTQGNVVPCHPNGKNLFAGCSRMEGSSGSAPCSLFGPVDFRMCTTKKQSNDRRHKFPD